MILLILLLGFCTRFLMLLSQKPYWGDEWYSIQLAEMSLVEMFKTTTFESNHPPLYLGLVNRWAHLFGQNEWAYRSLSMLTNLSVILIIYWLAKEFFGRKNSILSALLVATSPYYLQLSNEIRSYSVLAALTGFATVFFVKALRTNAQARWVWPYVILAVCSLYAEHYAWFWLFGITVYLTYLMATQVEVRKRWWKYQGLVIALGIPSLVLIFYQAIYDEGVLEVERLRPYYSVPILGKKAVSIFWRMVCGPIFSMLTVDRIVHYIKTSPLFWISFVATFSSVLLCLRSLATLFREKRSLFMLFSTIIIFPYLFLLFLYPIRLDGRYLVWAVPFFLMLLSEGILQLRPLVLRSSFVALLAGLFIYSNVFLIRLETDALHKEDLRGMVRYAFENADERVAICGIDWPTDRYVKELAITPRGTYFESIDQFLASGQKNFDEVWSMLYINMDPKENETGIFSLVDPQMAQMGFERSGPMIRFGGPDALTVIQVYGKPISASKGVDKTALVS
jgi:mannosyltransferase